MAPSRTDDAYDVVVVGGGHNGLVAACYLAEARLQVAVVEKNDRLGGMTTSAPLVAEAPRHLISPGAYENVYLRAGGVAEDLDLARFGYREIDSAGWAWLGQNGETLLFQRDVEATAVDIARFSRADADAYRELVSVALALLRLQDRYGAGHPSRPGARTLGAIAASLARDRRRGRRLAAMLTATAADAIASSFESEQVRGAFASIATILGAPTAEGSGIALLGPATLHHKGAARPVGGMGGLVAALQHCLASRGGEVGTGEPAVHIHIAGERAEAVELADGRILRARRAVIAACPPQRVPDLVGPALEPRLAERLRAAPANAAGVGALTVNLALDGRIELPAHQARRDDFDLRRPALFTGTLDGVLSACAQAARGEIAERLPWWLAIFTAMDQSQAPEGQDVAQLYAPVPVDARGGWPAQRGVAADRLVGQAAEVAPGLPGLELGRYVETPEDLSARTGTSNGCLYHVDHLPTRLGPLRPAIGAGAYRTPLAGLYLSGAGTHPGGGVSGLPGKLAAATVLSDLGG